MSLSQKIFYFHSLPISIIIFEIRSSIDISRYKIREANPEFWDQLYVYKETQFSKENKSENNKKL